MALIPVITIDGPSGSGKGTISKALAKKLQFNYLDSGALYRLAALVAIKNNINLQDETAIIAAISNVKMDFSDTEITINGKSVTQEIRQEKCSQAASAIAKLNSVREFFVEYQRKSRLLPGLVADGRDMGSVIFPDAILKIFLNADVEKRAERRLLQLQQKKGNQDTLKSVLLDMKDRDNRDKNRKNSPLVVAKGANIIDATNLTIEETMQAVLLLLKKHTSIIVED